MARSRGHKRQRGTIDALPSGALRVRVYAGTDPVTKRRHDLVEVVPAGPHAERLAEEARVRLLNEVYQRRHPRTNATVDQMLERHFRDADLEYNTLDTYKGYAAKHISPLLGTEKIGSLDAGVMESFYAELRRCRDHCDGSRGLVDHRTPRKHACDERCRPHVCKPLAASTIRQLTGAFLELGIGYEQVDVGRVGSRQPLLATFDDTSVSGVCQDRHQLHSDLVHHLA